MKRLNTALLSLLLLMSVLLSACGALPQSGGSSATLDSIPAYSDQAYVELNGNQPTFTEDELVTESFETYSPLDSLGRCGVAYANVALDTMPGYKSEGVEHSFLERFNEKEPEFHAED